MRDLNVRFQVVFERLLGGGRVGKSAFVVANVAKLAQPIILV
jgi:hypothetical protein